MAYPESAVEDPFDTIGGYFPMMRSKEEAGEQLDFLPCVEAK
jgi:hypothetical protein